MQEELLKEHPLPEIANSLVQSANAYGGEDNISLVIIKKTANLELGEAPC
jgi:protein phosphatase